MVKEVIVEKVVVKEVEVEVIVEVIVTATPTPTPTPTATPTAITTGAELVRRVQHGIVRVTAGFSSAGSGFIFEVRETTAFVATNHHVIERERTVDVQVHTGHTYKALVLGWDSDLDVAVLAICCSREFTALRWDPAEREVGTQVIAVGFPRSTEGGLTATIGETVAHDAISRQHGFIPHSAPLNPGNSGGPLFAMPNATVLGINTAGGLQELRFYAVPYQAVEESMEDWRAQLVVAPAPTPVPKRSFPTVEAGLSAYTVNDIRDPAPLGQYYDLEIGKRVVALGHHARSNLRRGGLQPVEFLHSGQRRLRLRSRWTNEPRTEFRLRRTRQGTAGKGLDPVPRARLNCPCIRTGRIRH